MSVNAGDSVEVAGPIATYSSSEWAERQFCPPCGSGLFWRLKAGGMTMVPAARPPASDQPCKTMAERPRP